MNSEKKEHEELSFPVKKKKRVKGVMGEEDVQDKEYPLVLKRLYDQMPKKTGTKTVIEPPCVVRSGKRQSVLINLLTISKQLNREPSHLSKFISIELGTKYSTTRDEALLLNGVFTSKHLGPIISGYAKEYVFCKSCFNYKTDIRKIDRSQFLCCSCGSKRLITPLEKGFVADVSKRKDRN